MGSSFLESHREKPNNLMIYTYDVREESGRGEAADFSPILLLDSNGIQDSNRNSK